MVKIKRMSFGFFDVFMGEGWENWTRVRKIKTQNGFHLKFISGNLLRKHQLEQIQRMV